MVSLVWFYGEWLVSCGLYFDESETTLTYFESGSFLDVSTRSRVARLTWSLLCGFTLRRVARFLWSLL